MKGFLRKIKTWFYSLMYGMKITEDEVFHQSGISHETNASVVKEAENQSMINALLRGEVTQEVEELRYRTYLVDKESKGFKYYAPTLALKKEAQDSKFMKYDDSDGLELITIQPNDALVESVDETLKQVGGRGKRTEYRIKVERGNFIPRYKIEQYIKRVDVKRLDETHAILDMYVSIYPNDKDFKSKGFVREVEKIRDEKIKTDIFDIDEISFVTHHAYKMDDMVKFVFRNIRFREIVEFDGHYILRCKASLRSDNMDLTKKYYSKSMADKYETNEKKDVSVNFEDYSVAQVYTCQECGKEVILDHEMIDKLAPYKERDVTKEKIDNENPEVLEFLDMQISKQTFGKMLCSDCLKKYLKENNLI